MSSSIRVYEIHVERKPRYPDSLGILFLPGGMELPSISNLLETEVDGNLLDFAQGKVLL